MAKCIDCGKQIKDIYQRCYSCNNKNQKTAKSPKEEANEPSEGELFLQEYFESEGITAKREKPIIGLKNDSRLHRKADFYLSNYGIYVEFLGRWFVSEEEKNRYREKKKVYQDNNIPCIFLYPENLGIIDFILPTRAIKEFKKHGLTKGLWLFRLKFLWAYKSGNIVLVLFLIYALVFGDFKWEEDSNWILAMIGISAYQVYTIYQFYKKKLD